MKFALLTILTTVSVGIIPFELAYPADSFSIGGYYKNFFAVYVPSPFDFPGGSINDPEKGVVINRLRLDSSYDFADRLDIDVSYSIAPRIQDNSLFYSDLLIAELDQFDYRAADFDFRLYPCEGDTAGSFAVFHNIDRLYLNIEAEDFDLYIGRQAIAWGSARVVNPTDILAPYKFEELDTEERIGIDAIRTRIPLGMLSELDVGVVSGDDLEYESSAAFARGKFYTMKADISALLVVFRENLLAGFDLATSWGGAGVWMEAAYVWPDILTGKSDNGGNDNYLRLSFGGDYSFGEKTYGFIEYHLNQAGSCESDEYIDLFSQAAYMEGSVYLLGQHYLIPGITYQITPLMTYSGQLLTNLCDPSVYFYSRYEYSISPNIYLGAGIFIGSGENPELTGQPITVTKLKSEFGTYPDIYFTSFSVYF